MPDNKNNSPEKELELEDMISNAIKAKKERHQQELQDGADTGDAPAETVDKIENKTDKAEAALNAKRQSILNEVLEERSESKPRKEKISSEEVDELIASIPKRKMAGELEEKKAEQKASAKEPAKTEQKAPAKEPAKKAEQKAPAKEHQKGQKPKAAAVAASAEMPDISFNGKEKEKPEMPEKKPEEDIKLPDSAPKRESGASDKPEEKKSKNGAVKKAEPSTKAAADANIAERPSSAGQKKKKNKWNKKQKTFFTIGVLFIIFCLLVLVAVLIFHHYYSMTGGKWNEGTTSMQPTYSADDSTQSDTFDPLTAEERIKKQLESIQIDLMKDTEVFNILLVGQDLRSTKAKIDNENERGNTDVMMLVSLNHKNKTITMTSFMRDIWLYIPPCDYSNRLNAAYYAGGPEYLQITLEAYFGVSIDRYVVVTFNQFIDIVDTLGGLDIEVTPEEANGYQYADPYGDNTRGMQNPLDEQNRILGNPKGTDYIDMSYDVESQVVHMNGNQALAFSRIRHVGNSDFDRTKRQRLVISKIIAKAREASLSTLDELLEKILPETHTNILEGEAASLVLNVLDYVNYDVQDFRVPEEGTYSNNWINGNAVLLCNTVRNAIDLQQLIYGETNIDEEKLRQYARENAYLDDYGNWIDYNYSP